MKNRNSIVTALIGALVFAATAQAGVVTGLDTQEDPGSNMMIDDGSGGSMPFIYVGNGGGGDDARISAPEGDEAGDVGVIWFTPKDSTPISALYIKHWSGVPQNPSAQLLVGVYQTDTPDDMTSYVPVGTETINTWDETTVDNQWPTWEWIRIPLDEEISLTPGEDYAIRFAPLDPPEFAPHSDILWIHDGPGDYTGGSLYATSADNAAASPRASQHPHFAVEAVPEPASLTLLGLGGLALLRRRRRS